MTKSRDNAMVGVTSTCTRSSQRCTVVCVQQQALKVAARPDKRHLPMIGLSNCRALHTLCLHWPAYHSNPHHKCHDEPHACLLEYRCPAPVWCLQLGRSHPTRDNTHTTTAQLRMKVQPFHATNTPIPEETTQGSLEETHEPCRVHLHRRHATSPPLRHIHNRWSRPR